MVHTTNLLGVIGASTFAWCSISWRRRELDEASEWTDSRSDDDDMHACAQWCSEPCTHWCMHVLRTYHEGGGDGDDGGVPDEAGAPADGGRRGGGGAAAAEAGDDAAAGRGAADGEGGHQLCCVRECHLPPVLRACLLIHTDARVPTRQGRYYYSPPARVVCVCVRARSHCVAAGGSGPRASAAAGGGVRLACAGASGPLAASSASAPLASIPSPRAAPRITRAGHRVADGRAPIGVPWTTRAVRRARGRVGVRGCRNARRRRRRETTLDRITTAVSGGCAVCVDAMLLRRGSRLDRCARWHERWRLGRRTQAEENEGALLSVVCLPECRDKSGGIKLVTVVLGYERDGLA